MTRQLTVREALNEAHFEEMRRDEDVFLIGEEVAEYDGAYKVSKGLLDEFGSDRVVDTPIVEAGFTGVGLGAAMVGLRPIVEVMTFNFSILALDQILNNAAKMRYMSGGQLECPVTIRGPGGAGGALAATHSQSLEAIFAHFPGLKVAMPSNPRDAKGMLKTAIRDPDPVIFIESEVLYNAEGQAPDADEEYTVPLGEADVVREGSDCTLISWSRMFHFVAREAADELAEEYDIDVDLIDLRSIRPFDRETLRESIQKTNRAVILEEGWPHASVGTSLADWIQRDLFDWLDAPVERVHQRDVPMPYAFNLEEASLPSIDEVVEAVKRATYFDF
ncbi:MAG: pyruvate dehydrogenase complex E1 component subunit beta [Bradymonadaceae bacterium]